MFVTISLRPVSLYVLINSIIFQFLTNSIDKFSTNSTIVTVTVPFDQKCCPSFSLVTDYEIPTFAEYVSRILCPRSKGNISRLPWKTVNTEVLSFIDGNDQVWWKQRVFVVQEKVCVAVTRLMEVNNMYRSGYHCLLVFLREKGEKFKPLEVENLFQSVSIKPTSALLFFYVSVHFLLHLPSS